MKYILLILMLTSCLQSQEEMDAEKREKYIPIKPFVICSKDMDEKGISCYYYYYDANKEKFVFEDLCTKYSIGDTIK